MVKISRTHQLIIFCFKNLTKKMGMASWVQVAPACNPSHLGGRDQEDRSSSQP
jgi:hypothetical protein